MRTLGTKLVNCFSGSFLIHICRQEGSAVSRTENPVVLVMLGTMLCFFLDADPLIRFLSNKAPISLRACVNKRHEVVFFQPSAIQHATRK